LHKVVGDWYDRSDKEYGSDESGTFYVMFEQPIDSVETITAEKGLNGDEDELQPGGECNGQKGARQRDIGPGAITQPYADARGGPTAGNNAVAGPRRARDPGQIRDVEHHQRFAHRRLVLDRQYPVFLRIHGHAGHVVIRFRQCATASETRDPFDTPRAFATHRYPSRPRGRSRFLSSAVSRLRAPTGVDSVT